jgi:hypothetical protein
MKRETFSQPHANKKNQAASALLKFQNESRRRRFEPRSKRLWEQALQPFKLHVVFRPTET